MKNKQLVSTVARANATATSDMEAGTLLNGIRTGKWRHALEEIRGCHNRALVDGLDPKAATGHLKKKLLGVMWSGRFSSRVTPAKDKLIAHTGLLCADLDDLGDQLAQTRAKIITSPYLSALFTSPSGCGLKGIFLVAADAGKHMASFHAVERHVYELTGIKIDQACKDVSRLCFVSYDPELWMNEHEPVEIALCEGSPLFIRLNAESCITESLNDCIPTSLHNKPNAVLENIQNRRTALATMAAKHPNLVSLYVKLIEPRHQAQARARNEFVVQAVTFLYHAVAPRFVMELVGYFFDCNRALFNDSRQQHLKDANAMLESVAQTYTESLDAFDRSIYEALPENERDAFRICRDLASLIDPDKVAGTFYMSCNQLGDRLGIHPPQAQRILWQMESYGLIKLLEKGVRRAAGVRPIAGTYQWLLSQNP